MLSVVLPAQAHRQLPITGAPSPWAHAVWHSPECFFAEAEPTHVPQLDASVFALRDGEAYTSRIVGKSQLTAEYRYTL